MKHTIITRDKLVASIMSIEDGWSEKEKENKHGNKTIDKIILTRTCIIGRWNINTYFGLVSDSFRRGSLLAFNHDRPAPVIMKADVIVGFQEATP
tara:strand:- start:118 stop:402 length:285 start_codon:yes stop_codon:yes gene_type:complete